MNRESPWGVIGAAVLIVTIIFLRANRSDHRDAEAETPNEPERKPAEVIKVPEKVLSGTALAAGNLFEARVTFEFAIYFVPEPAADPKTALTQLCKTKFTQFHERAELLDEKAPSPSYCIRDVPIKDYQPPSGDRLAYFIYGLSDDQKTRLSQSKKVVAVDFAADRAGALAALKDAHELMLQLATETKGLLWDEETRETFTPEAWKERRLAKWTEAVPNIKWHVVMHEYPNGEFNRLVTLGMAKFGLPDVCIEDAPKSSATNLGNVINLACQTMLETGKIDTAGILPVDVAALRNNDMKASFTKSLLKGATGRAALNVALVPLQQGDAANRLVEIQFPASLGGSVQQRQEAVGVGIFGAQDAIVYVKHDDELLDASNRAKEKIKDQAKLFRKGLPTGEELLLKAPFKTPTGGNEWMWVEVSKWGEDGKIEGILANDPFEIPTLKSGARVRVEQDSLFDYIHAFPDGHTEGNETGEIMERREKAGKK